MDYTKLYSCKECGLHYKDENKAKDCEEFCRANNACNVEIIRHSIEADQNSREQ